MTFRSKVMTRSQTTRSERNGEYYFIGHILEGGNRGYRTVYRTKDNYHDSDDKRFKMGNYFASFDDARRCLNEYEDAKQAFKELHPLNY